MNILYKAWCRTFQFFFRLAQPLLPYTEPELLNSLSCLKDYCAKKKVSKLLIVTDAGLVKAGVCAIAEEELQKAGIEYTVYDKTVPNPTVQNVAEAAQQYRETGAQAILALGGGSAMDCAKAAGCCIARPRTPINWLGGVMRVWVPLPLIIAVPTTAGTGSETTLAAVITDPATHHKYAIMDFPLIPCAAVHDYRLTLGLPPHITSTTGMDALVHAVEAFIGQSTTKYTRRVAIEAVSLIRQHLVTAYEDGQNVEARQQMLHAAFCAGNAFSISYVGYVHSLAHALGGRYGTPHGLANAVLLPHVLRAFGKAAHAKLAMLARESGVVPCPKCLADGKVAPSSVMVEVKDRDNDAEVAEAFITWVEKMNERMNIPTRIEALREEDLHALVSHALAEGNPLYPVPVIFGREELTAIYHKIM